MTGREGGGEDDEEEMVVGQSGRGVICVHMWQW